MAKKRKEKKKDSTEIPEYTLDAALKSSKTTKSDLQGILRGFSEEKGYVSTPKEDKKIAPQLSYEAKQKIAEDYVMEEVPLSERASQKARVKEEKEPKKVEVEVQEQESTKEKKVSSTKKQPSFSKQGDIYEKLNGFFEELITGYSDRYEQWENSISSILSILRKMRKITKKNTEDLVSSINNMYGKIQDHLDQFKIKRDQVELISQVDIESLSSEFKKVLGLLELQVKEYQLKRLTDEFVHEQTSLP
jgi:hypothetical protein